MERTYIIQDKAYLKKAGRQLCLMRGKELLDAVPLNGLKQLTLIGYLSLSGAVVHTLIENRIETVLLDGRGRYRGRLVLDESKHVQLRRDQYLKLSDDTFLLHTARLIVQGKLANQARLLRLRGLQLKNGQIMDAALSLKALQHSLNLSTSIEHVRGMEGRGAHLYFQQFGKMIRNESFDFPERNRRPPLDPVNALLSFVYTLLTQEVLTAIKIIGLDPYLGALHAPLHGRPSLACDLVEEWRSPLGDRFVLGLVNKKMLTIDDFVFRNTSVSGFVDEKDLKQQRPVEMKPQTCRLFIEAYENMMEKRTTGRSGKTASYRGRVLEQVRLFARYLSGEQDGYDSFSF